MKIRSRFLTWLVSGAIVLGCKSVFRTLRIEFHISDQEANPFNKDSQQRFIYCVWHDAVPVPMFAKKHPRTVALVSRHQDGSYLARGLKMIGVGTVRGSSKHGGASAVRELLRSTEDKHIVVTPDGPRGPRREMKVGPIYLSSRLQKPIVPTAYSYSRSWRIPAGWTDLCMPKPFAKVYAVAGEPIVVPEDATREELELARLQVQAEMDRLTLVADALVQGKKPEQPLNPSAVLRCAA